MLKRFGVANEPGSFKPSLQDCLEAVLEQSDTMVDDVLTGLQLALTPTRNKTSHALQNPACRAVIESLCARRDAVKKSFTTALRTALYRGEKQNNQARPMLRFDDFQFLEETQIDANIEFALTQQEVEIAVDDVLPMLNALISSMLGWITVQPNSNPLKPESFVHALRTTLLEHVPNGDARIVLMTPAAGILGVGMRQLYKEVSEWLRSQGVEPVGPVVSPVGGYGAQHQASANSVASTMLTLDKLRRLLSGELGTPPATRGSQDFTYTVPASFVALQDLKLMEPMMSRLATRARQLASPPVTDQASFVGNTGVKRESTEQKKLGSELGQEVVRLMLENLMQERRLLPSIRQSLKKLEPALIRLSQADARFFSQRQHPARLFLDKITNRSLAFTEESDPGLAHFKRNLDHAVDVLTSGEGDAVVFAQVLQQLEEIWTREEHEQRLRAEETARGLLHAEQRNQLAQSLAAGFTQRVENKDVPEIVINFLRGPWAQVVAESQLRCADGTVDADGYLSVVDDLIWSVQPRLTQRNRARLVDIVPEILVKIRQGLSLISYPEERIPVFFDTLIGFHEQAFEGTRPTPVASTDMATSQPTGAPVDASDSVDAPWAAEDKTDDSGHLHDPESPFATSGQTTDTPNVDTRPDWTIQNLTTGSWVDLTINNSWVRAQLTWASPHKTLFMFISGAGLAHSMSRRTIDRLRSEGLIRLVSDGRVLDQALDAVAQAALRNDMGNAGTKG
ncbi:MAG: DUF1631 family protein [Rhodoferax sp.]|nr:DUF1631 family protein [Rhodoferax sp.]